MRNFAVQVIGLQEALGSGNPDVVIGLMEELEALPGIATIRFDPSDTSIHLEIPDFEGEDEAPGFAQISHLVQTYGNRVDHPMTVGMIHRTRVEEPDEEPDPPAPEGG